MILMPILGFLMPVSQIPASLSIGSFSSSASRIMLFYKNVHWPVVKYFVPFALPAVWLGAYLLKYVNPLYLEILMGLFLISNLPLAFRTKKFEASGNKPNRLTLCSIGFIAGLLSALTGAVGLLFNSFYLKFGLSKEEVIATRAANEITLHLIKILLYLMFGLINQTVFLTGFAIALAAILSSISMKYILPRISLFSFKKIGFAAMGLSGILMLLQSGRSILTMNQGNLSSQAISKGIETKLQWQNANFALEFTYDDGFEFEQVIPIEELNREEIVWVQSKHPKADQIVIEKVHTIGKQYYEAYYFQQHQLIEKLEF